MDPLNIGILIGLVPGAVFGFIAGLMINLKIRKSPEVPKSRPKYGEMLKKK